MSLLKEVFSGYAQLVRMENSIKLQAAAQVRPAQVKMQVASTLCSIKKELAADAELKAVYDTVVINVPA